jgi:hypothetical protein
VPIDNATNLFSQHDCRPLGFGRRVAKTVDQRQIGTRKNLRRRLDRVLHRRGLSID